MGAEQATHRETGGHIPVTVPRQLALFEGSDNATGPAQATDSPRPTHLGRASIDYKPAGAILTKATGFMDSYDFTLNPYSGCAFGCTYCYAAFFSRASDSMTGAERRDSWGRWVEVKENAVALLERRRKRLDGTLIYMSSVTDPYQPIERTLKLTQGLLDVLAKRHRPKLVVQTRSPDVVRDAYLFREIVANGGRVQVNLTVTTDDEDVRRTFEPTCPSNARRLGAARELVGHGIATCVTMTPLLPVQNAERFADDLLATGVQRFIVQPFHFQSGKFVAGTRDAALDILATKLDCDQHSVPGRYLEHYDRVRDTLHSKLPGLGEGKDGFKPPF